MAHSMRDHLKAMHAANADSCAAMSKCHDALSKCFGKLAKSAGDETMSAAYGELSASHEKLATNYLSAGEISAASAKELSEAPSYKAGVDDLNKIVPDRVSSVQSMDAPNYGIKAVPRYGAPEPVTKTMVAAIDPKFRHLISMPDDEV